MSKPKSEAVKHLYEALLLLKTPEECERFLDDACTVQEIEAIAQRLAVAGLLSEGKNYNDINRLTGASTATICRVSKCLNYGDGGYTTIITRMREEK